MYQLPTPDKKTFRIADELRKLEMSEDIDDYAPKIIAIMEAAGDSFRQIDERESYWNFLDGRFYMLRRVRNHQVWGPKLFRAIALTRKRR